MTLYYIPKLNKTQVEALKTYARLRWLGKIHSFVDGINGQVTKNDIVTNVVDHSEELFSVFEALTVWTWILQTGTEERADCVMSRKVYDQIGALIELSFDHLIEAPSIAQDTKEKLIGINALMPSIRRAFVDAPCMSEDAIRGTVGGFDLPVSVSPDKPAYLN